MDLKIRTSMKSGQVRKYYHQFSSIKVGIAHTTGNVCDPKSISGWTGFYRALFSTLLYELVDRAPARYRLPCFVCFFRFKPLAKSTRKAVVSSARSHDMVVAAYYLPTVMIRRENELNAYFVRIIVSPRSPQS